MKNYLIIIAIFIVSSSCYGQTSVYHPLPASNAVWSWQCDGLGSGCCCNCFGNCLLKMNYQDSIGGDTIIGLNTYQIVWESSIREYYYSFVANCAPWGYPSHIYDTEFYHYRGAIRQVTTQKKVYYIYDTTEVLLYDFDLAVGDTLPVSAILYSEDHFVTQIDSIIINGSYRKRFKLWNINYGPVQLGNEYLSFIEGIGSTFGLFEPLSIPFEYNCGLACVKVNSGTYYPDSAFACEPLPLGVGIQKLQKSEDQFTISPNPFSNTTIIQSNRILNEATLNIYNSLGQMVKSMSHINNQSIVIERNNLVEGIYYMMIIENGIGILSQKLIIKNN